MDIVTGRWLSTAEAARRLGVKPASIYAYVSRGLLPRHRDGKQSRFHIDDVERLAARSRSGTPSPTGELVVHTEITEITDGVLRYRGHDAVGLAARAAFEAVAELLWGGPAPDPLPPNDDPIPAPGRHQAGWEPDPRLLSSARATMQHLPPHTSPLDRLRVACSVAAAGDPLAHDRTPDAVRAAGRRLIPTLVAALPEVAAGTSADETIAGRLWRRLSVDGPDDAGLRALDAALVLLADHELAASTLAARVAASTRCGVATAVECGLAAVSGPLHGGASFAVEELLVAIPDPEQAPAAVDRHLRGRGRLPGFGHFAYPEGDPRAVALLGVLDRDRTGPRPATVRAVLAAAAARGQDQPNVDLALAALTYLAGMPPGSGEAIFAVARTAGWIAHALEQYEHGRLIRPRAVYVGAGPRELD